MKIVRLMVCLLLVTFAAGNASAQESPAPKPKEAARPAKTSSSDTPDASFGNFDYWVYPVKHASPRKLADMLKRLPFMASVTVDERNRTLTILGVRGFSNLNAIKKTLDQLDREDTTVRSIEMRTFFIAATPAVRDEKLPSALTPLAEEIRTKSGYQNLHLIASTVSVFSTGQQTQFRTNGSIEQTVGDLKGFFEYKLDLGGVLQQTDGAGKDGLALSYFQMTVGAPVLSTDRANEPRLEMKSGLIQSSPFIRLDDPVILGSMLLGNQAVFVVVTMKAQN